MKKLGPLKIIHLVLMIILLILSLISAVMLFAGVGFNFGMLQTNNKLSVILFGIFNVVNAAALCFGIVYSLKGYTKKAAFFYKASLFTRVIATAICFVMMTFNFNVSGITIALIISIMVLLALKGVIMAYMTFKKNLGKENTWKLFHVLVVIDVVLGVLFIFNRGVMLLHTLVNIFSRLALDCTIGLAVRGKYEDKDERGTV